MKLRHGRCSAALLTALVLLTTSCGTLLSQEEREATKAALARGRSAAGGSGAVSGGGAAASGEQALGGTTDGGGGGGGGLSSGGGGDGEQAVGGPGGASCAKATKATDTGVSANKVTVATLADISGVQPGLFESSHQAARAATAYINSQGGICGRAVEPLLLDSKTDSGGNRAAMLEACQKAFAVVGSMSAFDDGSAAPGRDCGIPDMTAITTNAAKYNAPNVFPVSPNGPSLSTTPARYVAQKYPDVIKKAAMLWLNQAVTKNNAVSRMKAYQKEGFRFIYQAEAQVLEANYTRFVQEMRSRGVQYVNMVSDHQSIVRLQKAMRQQGYVPKVRQWDSVAYDADYLAEPTAVEGSLVFINTAMLEEASANPEMKLYTDWLQRASPGATPDFFGMYTWSAYRLFQSLATRIGPDLTREKMLAALKATKEWNAHGMHAPHRIGEKLISTCNINLEVRGGKFVRLQPASGFDCNGALVDTS
jgi:ABC-type branched-subunit amino acid transport system substrate-binding protein